MARKSLGRLICTLVLAQATVSRADPFVVDQLLNNVVTISASSHGSSQYGLGFIIGRRGDVLWIATAAHVVFPNYAQDDIVTTASVIEARRRGDDRLWRPVEPPQKGIGGDIAFIGLDVPLRFGPDLWRERSVVHRPAIGTLVLLAGRPNMIAYGAEGARVSDYSSGRAGVNGLVGASGQSGAPIATSNGFIGMYVSSAGDRFLPMSVIEGAAKAAGLPWQLSSVPDQTAVRLCLRVLGLTESKLEINTPKGIQRLDNQGCISTFSGDHSIIRPRGVMCSLERFIVATEAGQNEDVECFLDPSGQWVSTRYGYMTISASSTRLWVFAGLNLPGHGWLKGTISGQSPILFLNGDTQSGNQLVGTIKLESRRITGVVTIGGSSYELDFAR